MTQPKNASLIEFVSSVCLNSYFHRKVASRNYSQLLSVCVCVCVCVCVKERDKVSVCVCVCGREEESVREREKVSVCVFKMKS